MIRTAQRLLPLVFVLAACGEGAPPPDTDTLPHVGTFVFESLGPDEPQPGFTVVQGTWAARPAPETGDTAIAQLAENAGPVFNVVLVDDVEVLDLDVRTRVLAVSGEIDRGGGLVWRARDGRNYYVCRFNPLESNYRVYKVIDGERIQLASARAAPEDGWREVRATMRGPRIECFLDGEKLLEVEDRDLPAPGRVGLWTKADAVSFFDRIEISGVRE